jgi:ABC-type transport system substrate-binding protein
LDLFSINVVPGFTNWVTGCQIMADELREIGLGVSIKPISFGAWFSALQLCDYDTSVARSFAKKYLIETKHLHRDLPTDFPAYDLCACESLHPLR